MMINITIGNKTISFAVGNIFEMYEQFDAMMIHHHRGFNILDCCYRNFREEDPDYSMGVNEVRCAYADVFKVVSHELDAMERHHVRCIALNPIYTIEGEGFNYKAQYEMIRACKHWFTLHPDAYIEHITLVDMNRNRNFATIYNEMENK